MQTKIKTIKSYLRILFFLPIFVVGCSSDDSTPNPNPDPAPNPPLVNPFTPPTAQQFKALKDNALDNKTQTTDFVVDASSYVSFTSAKGVNINLLAENLTIGGVPLEIGSTAQVKFIELYNKADLLTTGIATMGKHTNGDLEMLITGGAFYLDITQNGQSVEYSFVSLNINVPASLTGGFDDQMVLWYGDFNQDGDLIWEEAETGGIETGGGNFPIGTDDNTSYFVFTTNLGWINVDHFWNDSRPKADLTVQAPEGYNLSNSALFLSFDGVLGLAQLYYSDTTKTYQVGGDYIPVGQSGSVIFVSESEGKWVYAIKSFIVAQNNTIEILASDLDDATQSEIEALVEALP